MADYLVTTLEDEQAHASQSPRAMAELIEGSAAHADALRRAGQLVDSGRFRPSKEGKRVGRQGDRVEVRDGPFAEEGRALGSYLWVRAASLDEATGLATKVPVLPGDAVDVRPLLKGRAAADKEAKPGKIFGCAVLGSAGTEEAWVEVMNRIDAESQGDFPQGLSLGGLRLQPPRQGRRIAPAGDHRATRATFDGPFLESKEVVGGLFFVRMTGQDDVVRWARSTRFILHGALEIRELWRT